MKLFSRYNRINLLATILIFLVAAAAFYFTLNFILTGQIDDDLKIERNEIISFVKEHDHLPESISVKDQVISYSLINLPLTETTFTTTSVTDSANLNKESFRQLVFGVKAEGQWYKATVSKSLKDTESLRRSVLVISLSTIMLILAASFIINRVVLKRIWQPFYHSLNSVKEFKLSSNESLEQDPTGVEEFDFMNSTLERLTSRARLDYLSLKTFSENASHEIQTPLAIIRSKLDLMIQDEQLTEQQSKALQGTYDSIQKLTTLNQSLLLLARIENHQYEEVQAVDLKKKLQAKIQEFQELWSSQQLSVSTDLRESAVNMNADLADILINNLLSNATKHNYPQGSISIDLEPHRLVISNTSNEPALDREKLFQRFYKPSQNTGDNGLGLSIIKQIADASGCTIEYYFRPGLHGFRLGWSN